MNFNRPNIRILPTPVSDCARARSRVCASTRARAQSNRCRSSESSTRASALPPSCQARLSSLDLDKVGAADSIGKQGCKAFRDVKAIVFRQNASGQGLSRGYLKYDSVERTSAKRCKTSQMVILEREKSSRFANILIFPPKNCRANI